MNLVPAAIGKTIARNSLHLQKASPGVLLGAGIGGMVVSTFLACRATLKVEGILDEAQHQLTLTTKARFEQPDKYHERDRQKDVALIYFQAGVKIAKAYGPAIIVGGVSIYALTTSHNILNKRNMALTAAYGALEKGFNEYRARVIEKYGEEEDRNFRYGSQVVDVKDPVTGKTKKVTRVGPDVPSIYARFFDENSSAWNKEPEYNLAFLVCQQNWANDILKAKGHIFLNEIYDALHIPRTQAGAVVGWVLTDDGSSDNFVNFGVFDDREIARDFVNGFEGSILLDFNVDGIIWDKI